MVMQEARMDGMCHHFVTQIEACTNENAMGYGVWAFWCQKFSKGCNEKKIIKTILRNQKCIWRDVYVWNRSIIVHIGPQWGNFLRPRNRKCNNKLLESLDSNWFICKQLCNLESKYHNDNSINLKLLFHMWFFWKISWL